jgi:ribosomal-protein-alanine N-acetyltransferase
MSDLIRTPRLLLRPLTLDDAEPVARLMTPDIARWTGSWKGETSARDVAERITLCLDYEERGLGCNRVIERLGDGALIGWIGARKGDHDPRRASIGYWIGEAYFGQGYTKEAAGALLPHLWTALDIDVIEGVVQLPNAASHAVLRGLGMRHVGQRMEFAPARGAADLCAVFEVERPDPPPP